ncbi:hypothetical protein [Streptomyces sp. NBC_01262]|uniref:hypothetical protein n=1 Tax=Streptomyces sp. NBC_01262 TaxID=2903803 RepID=UPI002E343B8D|nr:hypothetical protein [Streptomyces sp. NBC_01262]
MNARSGTIALAALAFGGAALLTAAPALAAPGDTGTVDIREVGSTTAGPTLAVASVCNFYLDATGFETVTQATWQIAADPAQPGGETRSGTVSLTNGAGVTAAVTPQLPNGTYKLTWSFLGQELAGKEKSFQVACPANADESTTDQAPAVDQPLADQPAAVQPAADAQAPDESGVSQQFGDDESGYGDGGDSGRQGSGNGGDWGDDNSGNDNWGGDKWGDDEGGYGGSHHRKHHHGSHHFWPNSGPHTGLGGSIAAASTGEIAAGAFLAAGAVAGGGLLVIRTARRRRNRVA